MIGVTTGLSQTQAQKSSLTVADPVETVKNVLGQMSGKTDAVIVLTYTGSEDITNALAAIDGVSIVIESGASEAFANTADNGTVITSAGTKGNVIGVASLDINRSDVSVDSQFYTSSDYSSLSAEQSVADAVASVGPVQLIPMPLNMQVLSLCRPIQLPTQLKQNQTHQMKQPTH